MNHEGHWGSLDMVRMFVILIILMKSLKNEIDQVHQSDALNIWYLLYVHRSYLNNTFKKNIILGAERGFSS